MTKNKISTFQFFSLLFLTKLLSTITYIPASAEKIHGTDLVIQAVLRIVFAIIISIPLYLQFKNNKDKNIIDISREKSKVFGRIITLLYSGILFYFTVITVLRLDLFTGTVVFPKINVNYFLLFVIIICCYGAYEGFEALGRSAVLSLFPILLVLIFIFITLFSKVELINFTPTFQNGAVPVLKTSIKSIGRVAELIVVALLIKNVSGQKEKGFFIWLFVQTFVTALFFFIMTGVMGNFADAQLFPMHTLSAIGEYAMFKRLDALVTGIWLLCAFLKISLFIYLQSTILHDEFQSVSLNTFIFIVGIFLEIVCLYGAGSVNRFLMIDREYVKLFFVIITVFAIPLYINFTERKKRDA